MEASEDKETKDEESEYDDEEEKNLNEIKLSEINGIKFNKKKCVENGLLEENGDKLYANLYPIEFTKDIEIYQYPFIITPECHEENVILKILREASPDLFDIYGYYYRSGNSLFAVKKVEEEKKIFRSVIVHRDWIQYTIIVKTSYPKRDYTIKAGKTHDFLEVQEKMIFLVLREILSANPYVHFDRDNLYLENKKEEVNNYFIHDGYKISIQQADIGICLIIGVKNKIKGKLTVLDFISNNEEEAEKLEGRRFIPLEGSRSQVISYIDFDRNPINTTRNYKQQTFKYYDYFDKIWNTKIKHKKQPLIAVEVKDPQYKEKIKYYVPELCYLVGINEEDTKNYIFMQQVIERTRLNPAQKIKQIEKCLDLFTETVEKKSIWNDKKGENLNTIYPKGYCDKNNTAQKKWFIMELK